jgi:hypothetical protein
MQHSPGVAARDCGSAVRCWRPRGRRRGAGASRCGRWRCKGLDATSPPARRPGCRRRPRCGSPTPSGPAPGRSALSSATAPRQPVWLRPGPGAGAPAGAAPACWSSRIPRSGPPTSTLPRPKDGPPVVLRGGRDTPMAPAQRARASRPRSRCLPEHDRRARSICASRARCPRAGRSGCKATGRLARASPGCSWLADDGVFRRSPCCAVAVCTGARLAPAQPGLCPVCRAGTQHLLRRACSFRVMAKPGCGLGVADWRGPIASAIGLRVGRPGPVAGRVRLRAGGPGAAICACCCAVMGVLCPLAGVLGLAFDLAVHQIVVARGASGGRHWDEPVQLLVRLAHREPGGRLAAGWVLCRCPWAWA